jgi:hypothetical protein
MNCIWAKFVLQMAHQNRLYIKAALNLMRLQMVMAARLE